MNNLIEFTYDIWNKHFNFTLIVYVFVVPIVFQIIPGNIFIKTIYALLSVIIIFIALTLMLCQIRLKSIYYQRRLGRLISIILDSGLISSINIIVYYLFLSNDEFILINQLKFLLSFTLSLIVSMVLFMTWILIFYYIRGYEIQLYDVIISPNINTRTLTSMIFWIIIFFLSSAYGFSLFIHSLPKYYLFLFIKNEFSLVTFMQLIVINILIINGLFFIIPLIIIKNLKNRSEYINSLDGSNQSHDYKYILIVMIYELIIILSSFILFSLLIIQMASMSSNILFSWILIISFILADLLAIWSVLKRIDPLFKDTVWISIFLLLVIPLLLIFLCAISFPQVTAGILEFLTIHYIFAVSFSYRSLFELKVTLHTI